MGVSSGRFSNAAFLAQGRVLASAMAETDSATGLLPPPDNSRRRSDEPSMAAPIASAHPWCSTPTARRIRRTMATSTIAAPAGWRRRAEVFLAGTPNCRGAGAAGGFSLLPKAGFGLGTNFLATWAAWQADPARCGRLQLSWLSKSTRSAHARPAGVACARSRRARCRWPGALAAGVADTDAGNASH